MTINQAKIIRDQYNLGKILKEPTAITGGLIHRMWRIDADTGTYAVKELNPTIVARPGLIENMNLCEKVAQEFVASGVNAIYALEIEGKYVCQNHDSHFIVYPWFEGRSLSLESLINEKVAKQMSVILAKIHSRDLGIIPKPESFTDYPEFSQWVNIKKQVKNSNYNWSKKVVEFIDNFEPWYSKSNLAAMRLRETLVFSHCDLDSKNVLWNSQMVPYIIDWESAGYINPTRDLIQLALSWSGADADAFDEDIFRLILESYIEVREVDLTLAEDSLLAILGDTLGWVKFNINRVLEGSVSSIELQNASDQILITMDLINLRKSKLDYYLLLVNQIAGL